MCIVLEPVAELVFGREDWPVYSNISDQGQSMHEPGLTLGKRHVWHMIVPNRIVQNKLMVSIAPIVANSLVAINIQGIDTKHLETSSNGETSLSGSYYSSAW